MTIKRTIFVFSIILSSLLFAGLATLLSLFLFVPQYLESEVIPSIAKDNGLEISSLKVRNIGLTGMEISDVKIGSDKDKCLIVDSIRLDYSISGLLGRHLEKVALSGISAEVMYENKSLSIEGLGNLLENRSSAGNKHNSEPSFTLKKLQLSGSIITLHVNGDEYTVPFDLTAAALDQDLLPGVFKLTAYPGGNRITIEGNRKGNNRMRLTATGDELSLKLLEDVASRTIPLDIRGKASFDLSATLSPAPFSIADISASCRLNRTFIDYQGIVLKNPVDPGDDELPVIISITSHDAFHWYYEVSSVLSLLDSIPVKSNLSGNLVLDDGVLSSEARAVTQLMTETDSPVIQWDISAHRSDGSEPLKIQLMGKTDKSASFNTHFNDINISALFPEINALIDYNKGVLSGSYLFKLKNIQAEIDEMIFSLPMVSVKGSIKQAENKMTEYISSFTIGSRNIYCKGLNIAAMIPDYLINGTLRYDPEDGLNTNASFIFKKGVMSVNDGSIKVKGISGKIPVSWPFGKMLNKGNIRVEEVAYGKYSLGPADIKLQERGKDISFEGRVNYSALPDIIINLSGSSSLDSNPEKAELNIEIPEYHPSSDIDLGRFLPQLKGFSFNGMVKSHGDVKFKNRVLTTGLDLGIENGRISSSKKRLTLENISLGLILEDLISPRSPFGQKLRIGKISFGDIQASNLLLDFRIDSLSSLFIEQGRFKWCGGNINIQSFRVDVKKDEYLLTLFCDRLKLADLLKQFGVAGVSGGGTVNGKIPVTISKGKIRFEDGFLYSTPGGGGKINIKDTDIFKQGMAPGSPEYIQMDIASEALKAFDYSWVKMSLNSEKDELTVKLQFDGKPENKLPFRYDKKINRFIRVEAVSEGSNFQGISIDVNFKLPLDELLNYKDALDMINF